MLAVGTFSAALQPERIQNTEYNFTTHYFTGASMAAPDPANSSKYRRSERNILLYFVLQPICFCCCLHHNAYMLLTHIFFSSEKERHQLHPRK
jgi:hypothetical protein